MFMLTSTHERILQEERKNFSDAWRTLAENRRQQILLYEKQIANLKELYINHYSTTGSDNVLPLSILFTALYMQEESDQPIKTTVDTSSNEIASAASSSSHYDTYSSPSSSYDSYSSSHSSSYDSSSSSSSSD